MLKFNKEEHTYIRYFVELDNEFLLHLKNLTGKNIVFTNDSNGMISDKLCAFALEGITQKDIEENIIYSLVDKIKKSHVEEIRIMAIDNIGIVVSDGNYAPYNLFVLRSNI